jgi:hypothetical protein
VDALSGTVIGGTAATVGGQFAVVIGGRDEEAMLPYIVDVGGW